MLGSGRTSRLRLKSSSGGEADHITRADRAAPQGAQRPAARSPTRPDGGGGPGRRGGLRALGSTQASWWHANTPGTCEVKPRTLAVARPASGRSRSRSSRHARSCWLGGVAPRAIIAGRSSRVPGSPGEDARRASTGRVCSPPSRGAPEVPTAPERVRRRRHSLNRGRTGTRHRTRVPKREVNAGHNPLLRPRFRSRVETGLPSPSVLRPLNRDSAPKLPLQRAESDHPGERRMIPRVRIEAAIEATLLAGLADAD